MAPPRTFDLIAALGDSARRAQAAQALAQRLGVEVLLLRLRDPDLDALVPAPGFGQTLRGGSAWREFLSKCRDGSDGSEQSAQPTGTQAVHVKASSSIPTTQTWHMEHPPTAFRLPGEKLR